MHDRLAGKAVGGGFIFKFALLHLCPVVGMLHAVGDFNDAGAALSIATAVAHFAPKCVDVDGVFHCLDAEICPIHSEYEFVFFGKLDVSHD